MINIDPTAKAVSFNPIQALKDEPDIVIDFLVLAAGEEVAEGVKVKAKEVALALARAKENANLLNLVDAFDQVPELKAFASKLREAAALDGQYGRLFTGSPDVAGKPIGFDEYHKLGSDPAVAMSQKLYQAFCAEREARDKPAK